MTHDSFKADFISIFRDWEKDFIEPKQIKHIPFPGFVDATEVQIDSMGYKGGPLGCFWKRFLHSKNETPEKNVLFPFQICHIWMRCLEMLHPSSMIQPEANVNPLKTMGGGGGLWKPL